MVLIEMKEDSSRFLCTGCKRTISSGINFLVKTEDLPKSRIFTSGDSTYYRCICGSEYELIKSANTASSGQLKFKHVRVIELGYAF